MRTILFAYFHLELVTKALQVCYSHRTQPLILHADNGKSMRGATLEVRLEELRVLRSFSKPKVSNDNTFSESLFPTVKYRPNYPSRSFSSKEEACKWVSPLWIDTTTNTAIGASNSLRLSNSKTLERINSLLETT